jgi:hypothetical protein
MQEMVLYSLGDQNRHHNFYNHRLWEGGRVALCEGKASREEWQQQPEDPANDTQSCSPTIGGVAVKQHQDLQNFRLGVWHSIPSVSRGFLAALLEGRPSFFWSHS